MGFFSVPIEWVQVRDCLGGCSRNESTWHSLLSLRDPDAWQASGPTR